MNHTRKSLFDKSLAFLEVAILSSKSKDTPMYNTSEYSNVTTYLLFHSTELFLKFAIYASTNRVEHGHDIHILYKKYKELYPDEDYEFKLPFTEETEYLGFTEEEINEHKEKYSMSFEQQLKYPVGNKGENYSPITIYETDFLEDYMEQLLNLGCRILPCEDV